MKSITTKLHFQYNLFITTFSQFQKKNLKLIYVMTLLLLMTGTTELHATDIGGGLVADMTLTLADSPYNVTSTLTVNTGITLTIEPGVVIEINNTGRNIDVFGTLIAAGTAADHISITSVNASGGGSLAIRDQGIATLEYVDFENLGFSSLSFYDTGMYIYDSDVTADNLTFNNCGLLSGTNHIIADANSISGFGSNNQIEQVTLINNSLNADAIWPDMDPSGFNYRLTGTQNVLLGTSLTIEPGVAIDFISTGVNLDVYGTLTALGTIAEHILFYSSGGSGGGSLGVRDGSVADLLYCDFMDLGFSSLSFYDAGLYIYETTLTADWLTFQNCGGLGGTRSITADANNVAGFGPNNQVDQVELISNTLNATTSWPNLDTGGFNYRLAGNQFVSDGMTLTIEPGVSIDLPNTGVNLEVLTGGTLFMEGTPLEHITVYSTGANFGGSVALRDDAEGHISYVDFADLGRSSLSFFDAGLYLDDVVLTADFMSFDSCGWGALRSIEANADYVDGLGNNNSVDMVLLRGGTFSKNAFWPLIDPIDYYYQLEGDVFVAPGFELTIAPGNQIHLPNTGVDLNIQGSLIATGTEADPIRMYSDAVNGGGSLALHEFSSTVIDYAEFEDLARSSLSFFDAGIYMNDCDLVADNMSFANCGWDNVRSIDALPFVVDNIGANNSLDQIRLRGATIGKNTTWPKVDQGEFSYLISGDIFVAEGFELNIEPGVQVNFQNTGNDLEVSGTLKAIGTAEEKIHFTSNTAGNGGGSIVFHAPSLANELSYCLIDSLAKSSLSFWDAAVYVNTGELTIQKSRIVESLRGIRVQNGQPTIVNNIIKDNYTWGLFNNTGNPDLLACDNYWGDPSGPYNATTNPDGLGNAISDNVIAADCAADALKIVCPDNASVNVGDDYSPDLLGFVEVCIQDCATLMSNGFVDSNPDPQCTEDMTRTWTVIDDCGNEKSCDQIIDFTDLILPTIVCEANVVLDCNQALPAVDFGALITDDNCEVSSTLLLSETEAVVGCVHTFTRTFEVEDPTGNAASCSQNIEVKIDLDAPVLSEMPGNVTVSCTDYPVVPSVTAMDDCDGPVTVVFNEDASEDPCILSLVRTWTATDECGNIATHTQVISGDRGAIVLLGVPVNETVECTELPLSVPTVTASDDCGAVTVTFDEVIAGLFCDGTITRTWTASDDCGNSTSETQIITVVKYGCLDPLACNYDIEAIIENDICSYAEGCDECTGQTDGTGAVIDNPEIGDSCNDGDVTTINDVYVDCGLCQGVTVPGCTDVNACNYDDAATVDDDTCVIAEGCDECDGANGVIDNPEIGDACDDGDDTTLNDVYTSCGICGGTAVPGCIDNTACNYDGSATIDDETCIYAEGCDECDGSGGITDNPEIGDTCDDGDVTTLNDVYTSCGVCGGTAVLGCIDDTACNYDGTATIDDETCVYAEGCDECDGVGGVTDNPEIGDACNDNDATTINDIYTACGVCEGTAILGCMDVNSCNYNELATIDDESCDGGVVDGSCDECSGDPTNGDGFLIDNPEIGDTCDDGDENTSNDIVQDDCACQGELLDMENDALACSDGLDNDGDDLIDCDDPDCDALSVGCSTCFNDGSSFADEVLDYFNNCPSNIATNPEAAIGVPDYGATVNHVTLGNGGYVTLAFTDNTLTNSGDNGPDLWVFEVGPLVESSTIELRPLNAATELILINAGLSDSDLDGFYEFGGIGGATASVDIDAIVPGQAGNTMFFDAIKVVDVPGSCSGSTPGADIDAVCALSSLPCSIGETCDDGDDTTINDVLQSDCSCSGVTVPGCTDEEACSYDASATVDDDTCIYAEGCDVCDGVGGVTDNPEVGDACDDLDDTTINDVYTSCDVCEGNTVPGCMDINSCNYNEFATIDDESCDGGVADGSCDECSGNPTNGDGFLIDNPEIGDACDDGDETTLNDVFTSCGVCGGEAIPGCMDDTACNYDAAATVDDTTCIYAEGCDACNEDGTIDDNPEIGDACDDGDDLTVNDVYVACDLCAGVEPICFDPNACNYTAFEDEGEAHSELSERGLPIGNDFCIYAFGCDECSGETDGTGTVIDNPEVGETCDDGDDATLNDMVQSDCVCSGLTVLGCTDLDACNFDDGATENDGSCIIPTGCDACNEDGTLDDNPEIGDACDDGDDLTVNDVYISCDLCVGSEPLCFDPNACNYTEFSDEGEANSELSERGIAPGNDFCVYAFGCDECSGEVDGTGTVIDNPEVGDACDDGDASTLNDVYTSCGVCEGEPCAAEPATLIPTSETVFCTTDDVDDTFTFVTEDGLGEFELLFATTLDGTILAALEIEPINLNGGADGEFLIYHMYYYGSPMLVGGDNITDFEGCFALSDPIVISLVSGDDCPIIYDCPELEANFGDECDDGNDDLFPDTINELCECEPGVEIFDCPELMVNIGDPCDDGDESTSDDVYVSCDLCEGIPNDTPPNDEPDGAIQISMGNVWGVPGWDTFQVGCATLSMQPCDDGNPVADSWYMFEAEAENQGILARANPSDPNAGNVDMVIEVFDADMEPLSGLTEGSCAVSRSCFNNSGAGLIERAVPTGLTIGDIYFYRVYDANGGSSSDCDLLIDTKVKTFASHPIVSGCEGDVFSVDGMWTIEDPVNLYNIPPVPVFKVRMVILDLNGDIVSTTAGKNPTLPGGLTFDISDFSPSVPNGSYTIHAQNEVKMHANGCVSAFWSQLGPGCMLEIGNGVNFYALSKSNLNEAVIDLMAYPNPNLGDQVFIQVENLASKSQLVTLELFDMFGKKLISEQYASNGSTFKQILTFENTLSGGIYFVHLSVNGQTTTQKLIVE